MRFMFNMRLLLLKCYRWLYATHFQTIGARQIFPCWDEPEFKATFNISIKHRKEYTVLSNMNYNTKIRITNTKEQWLHFNITPEISTYHVAFCLLRNKWFKLTISVHYGLKPFDSSHIILWNKNTTQASFARRVINKIALYSDNLLKNIEKISLIQHVLIPGLPYDAVQKWGLVFYR